MANLDRLDENRVETALTYLAGTDEEHAILSGEVKRLEELLKTVKAKSFLVSEGGVGEREQKALASTEYSQAVQEWSDTWKNFKIIDNKRQHEIRCIDVWRTLESSRRKGNV